MARIQALAGPVGARAATACLDRCGVRYQQMISVEIINVARPWIADITES